MDTEFDLIKDELELLIDKEIQITPSSLQGIWYIYIPSISISYELLENINRSLMQHGFIITKISTQSTTQFRIILEISNARNYQLEKKITPEQVKETAKKSEEEGVEEFTKNFIKIALGISD